MSTVLHNIDKAYQESVDLQKILQRFPDAKQKIAKLEAIQAHTYRNQHLPLAALFHRSALVFWAHDKSGLKSNEELEFLGDAFIGYFVAAEAMAALPNCNEAQLSRLRSVIAGTRNLATGAAKLGLPDLLITGQVDIFKPTGEPNALLADAFEAVTAALLVEAGHEVASTWLRRVLAKDILTFTESLSEKDEKSQFQEWVQSSLNVQPEYRVMNVIESPTQPQVEVAVYVMEKELGRAVAENKKLASQRIAAELMERVRTQELTTQKLQSLLL